MLIQEDLGGFENPGILTIATDAIGSLSAYHGRVFLGSLRAGQVVLRENDVLQSRQVSSRVMPSLVQTADAVANTLGVARSAIRAHLFNEWSRTVARLCIGLRRLGTGGAILITPSPRLDILDIGYPLNYDRLGEALVLSVLDQRYVAKVNIFERPPGQSIPLEEAWELRLAESDEEDRTLELTGATKAVTSLASIDGLLLLTPELFVRGFGVKIGPAPAVAEVYDGASFARRGVRARRVDLSKFGTRHGSMIRYCKADPAAVGVILSQDGQVRVVLSHGNHLVLWDGVKLLAYEAYSRRVVRTLRAYHSRARKKKGERQLGYTSTPKTLADLLRRGPRSKRIASVL